MLFIVYKLSPRNQTQVSFIAGRLFTIWATGEALYKNSCKGEKKKTQIKGNWWPSHSSETQF